MNREIKFKVWNGTEWCAQSHGFSPSDLLQGYPSANDYGYIGDLSFFQFTGFTDKNGEEIYQGDIVYYNPTGASMYGAQLAEIIWHSEDAQFMVKSLKKNYFGWSMDQDFTSQNLEVVGNIFNKPDKSKYPEKQSIGFM